MSDDMPPAQDDPPASSLDTAAVAAAFALAPIGVTITRDGVTEYCNPAYLAMFGYAGHEAEIYGKSLLLMIAPEHRAAIVARIDARRTGRSTEGSYDSWGLRRDGSTFPFHVAVRRIALRNGHATLAFFVDLTERRRIQEELRRARDELAALVEASPVPTMMIDGEGLVRVWNPAATTAFGWTRDEALGRINPLVREEQLEEYARNVEAALTTGLHRREARRRRKDGTEVELEIYAAPVHDEAGRATGTMAVAMDVTERRRTEDALRRSEEQLRHAQKMEAVGRLAGGVAHDFNNMLAVISGLTHVLQRQTDPTGPAAESVAELHRVVSRATALTRRLLAFSRRQILTLEDVDLAAFIRGMEPMLRTLAGADVTLVVEAGEVSGLTRADPGQLELVITNLAMNARDAMPDGGTLTVRTRDVEVGEELAEGRSPVPAGRYVAVEVTDVGVGMEPAILARLFEPFFTTKERGRGTGLGLSTAFGIVKQCGGHLRVRSEVGAGSTFEVLLPRRSSAAGKTDDPEGGPAEGAPPAVVVVDDDATIRRLTREMLEQAGLEAHEARDPEHALGLLRALAPGPRLLLTDVLMPDTSGPELARRALAEHPDLIVLYMSGYADADHFPAGLRQHVAGILQKPFDAPTLLRMLAEAVHARRAESAGAG